MIKTIFIPAKFKPITKGVVEKIPTGETKKNWLGLTKNVTKKVYSNKIVGYSQTEIDGQLLSEDIDKEIQKYTSKNARIISITPIISGNFDFKYKSQGISSSRRILSETEKVTGGGSFGYGYGYSYTEGVLICMELDD